VIVRLLWINAGPRIAVTAAARRGIGIVLACPLPETGTLGIGETCCRYCQKLSDWIE
jgi:hypothetical protein